MLKRPTPVRAPLRLRPRVARGGRASVEEISVSMRSMVLAFETLRRESWDCVNAVGVSGMSSSSEMGEGMRLLRSVSTSCRGAFQDGVCSVGVGTAGFVLFVFIAPAEPPMGYPKPFMPPLLKVGCIGVGIRPTLLAASELNNEGLSIAGRMKLVNVLKAGDSGGWLRISASASSSSSSMSMSKSKLLDS